MYIKQVVIEGFKSFKERTVLQPFDPGHNVIVGANGSGKTNFFYALQFVLSGEFANLNSRQRQALLHEGRGQRVLNAYVDIIFDNEDGRLPMDEKVMTIRRMIGGKQDQYFIDQRNVPRVEAMGLLESAGFTQSNPYYIVKQGKINQLATDPDSARLQLLQVIAGTQVHDDRKMKAVDSLKHTSRKIKDCESQLTTIRHHLEILKKEKGTLEKYQLVEKKQRCLEYVMYERDARFTQQNLNEYKKSRLMLEKIRSQHEVALKAAHVNTKKAKDTLNEAKSNGKIFQIEKVRLQTCFEKLHTEKSRLYFHSKSLINKINFSKADTQNRSKTLKYLHTGIAQIEDQLNSLDPTYDAEMANAARADAILSAKEAERNHIFARQNRGSRFQSKEERNKWIETELESYNLQIQEKEALILDLNERLRVDTIKLSSLENKLQILNIKLQECREVLAANRTQLNMLKEDSIGHHKVNNNLWKKQDDLLKQIDVLTHKRNRTQQMLSRRTPRGMLRGQESIRKVLESFSGRGGRYAEICRSYHGLVIDCFECQNSMNVAVSMVAGSRLFAHIVKDVQTATSIIKEMTRLKLPGEVSFITLEMIPIVENQRIYGPDYTPIIGLITCDDQYKNVVATLFGGILLVKNLSVKKANGLNGSTCVTVTGDVANSRGTLTGGFIDATLCSVTIYKKVGDLNNQIEGLNSELDLLKRELGMSQNTMIDAGDQVQRLLTSSNKAKVNCGNFQRDIPAVQDSIDILKSSLKQVQISLVQCRGTITSLQQACQCLEEEKEEELKSDLSSIERKALEKLNEDILELRKNIIKALVTKGPLKDRKEELEKCLLLKQTLKKIEEKAVNENNIIVEEKTQEHYCLLVDYDLKDKQLMEIQREIDANNEQVQKAAMEQETLLQDLSPHMKTENKCRQAIDRAVENLDSLFASHALNQNKHDELTSKIDLLGPVPPEEMIAKLIDVNGPTLLKKIKEGNVELKSCGDVNHKAISQFSAYTKLKQDYDLDYKSLIATQKELVKMTEDLDIKKNEAIDFTFKQVSKYFQELFKKMVPAGNACLVMYRKDSQESASSSEDSLLEQQFIGVGIKVAFVGDRMVSLDLLSGGQKTMVALTLIFAIQKCNPGPVYLFDEIDQALDPRHRAAVALMIHKLSKNAQFITTTFRPELLVHANKYYNVSYENSTSSIKMVTREDAAKFVCQQTVQT